MQNSKLQIKSQNLAVVAIGILLLGLVVFFKFSSIGTETLWSISDGGRWLLPLVGIAALIDSINPCAFSILLLTIAFLFSLGRQRSQILQIGSAYIFGIFLIYILIGLGLLHVLHIFGVPHFMAKIGAAVVILWGLISIVNVVFPAFPIRLRVPHVAHRRMAVLMEKGSMPTAFLLGGLVGLCEFPCTGGPYLMVLGLLHDSATYLKGLGYLLLYNLIFVLPLVIILLIASEKVLLEKAQEWRKKETKAMRLWGGAAMIGLGVLIFFL